MKNKIELLAPAGNFESLISAVQNKADAVYLGGSSFSARASANNFSDEELARAVSYAHFRGVKIYVAVNTILDEREVEMAADYISKLEAMGVDGLIIQDLGLAKVVKENFKDIEMHSSTQMTINSLEGAKLLEDFGFKRVVPARETKLSEIKLIRDNTNLDIEAFVHGALCVCYSGQCLMSSMIGGRSGNRGTCAQSCRRYYDVVKDGEVLKNAGGYLISAGDLCTLENVDKLIDAGVNSLKIEGRMKSPEYVAAVVSAYRKAIDGEDIAGEEEILKQVFNRKFTKGLAMGDFGRNFYSGNRPDNRGVLIGRVLKNYKNTAVVDFFEDINEGDVLEFETDRGYKTYRSDGFFASGENQIKIAYKLNEDSNVRRIENSELISKMRKSYEQDGLKRGVYMKFDGKIGKPVSLLISDGEITTETISDAVLEHAKNAPITEERISEQLKKLGDTDFYVKLLEISIEEDAFIPISKLNALRREAIENFREKIESANKREKKTVKIQKSPKPIKKKDLAFDVSINRKSQLKDLNLTDVRDLYLRFVDKKIYKKLKADGHGVYFRTEKILYHDDYAKISENLKDVELDGVLIDNLGGIKGFENYKKIADMGLNVFNSESCDFLNEFGVKKIILSPELTFEEIKNIRQRTDCELECIGYGFIRVMTMKHCPFSIIKNCGEDRNCEKCNFRSGYSLRDEKNILFKTERVNDNTTIYNSFPISMVDELERFRNVGVDSLLIDFNFEKDSDRILNDFKIARMGFEQNLNEELKEQWGNFTHGHYFRGVK